MVRPSGSCVWHGRRIYRWGKESIPYQPENVPELISPAALQVTISAIICRFFLLKTCLMESITIRIEVCGEKAEDATDCYIVLDYLRVLGRNHTEPVKLMINQDFSYPHISWGNVRKPPLVMRDGTCGTFKMNAVHSH